MAIKIKQNANRLKQTRGLDKTQEIKGCWGLEKLNQVVITT